MHQLYNKLNIKSFKLISTVCLLISDISIIIYLYFRFTDKTVFHNSMDLVMQAYPAAAGQITGEFESQLYQLLVNTLLTMLSLVFLYHSFIYLIWNRGKKFGHKYIYLYVLVAAPGAFLAGLLEMTSHLMMGLFWTLLGIIYTFVLIGLILKDFDEKEDVKNLNQTSEQ